MAKMKTKNPNPVDVSQSVADGMAYTAGSGIVGQTIENVAGDVLDVAVSATGSVAGVTAGAATSVVAGILEKVTGDKDAGNAVRVGVPAGMGVGGLGLAAMASGALVGTLAAPIVVGAALVAGAAAGLFFYRLKKNKKTIQSELNKHGLEPVGEALANGLESLPNYALDKLKEAEDKSHLKATIKDKQTKEGENQLNKLMEHQAVRA